MQFLDETLEAGESCSSMTENQENLLANVSLTQNSTNEESAIGASPKPKKRKRKDSKELTEFALKALNDLNNKTDDEEDIYGQYIASVLRSFDPLTRDVCKLEFSKIILKLRHNVDM